MDDCTYVVGLVTLSTPEVRSIQVPYIAVGPDTTPTRKEHRRTRDVLTGLVSEGMTRTSRTPYDVLGTCPPGWQVLLGPTRAAIFTPSGVVVASDVDTTTPPGWVEAIRALGDEVVVFYAATDQLGLGGTPVLTQLEQCAATGNLVGAALRCNWQLANPPQRPARTV